MRPIQFIVVLVSVFFLTTLQASTIREFSENKGYYPGYFPMYIDQETGKVFLEIDKFDQEFLFQSSLPQGIGSNDIGLDRGQLGDTRLVQFERVGKKVFLRQLNTYYRANTNNAMEKLAVKEAFASSIIWGFEVKASDDSGKVVIDYTPFLLSDIHNIGTRLKAQKQGNFSVDKSRSGLYQQRTKAFPENTELEATITYKGSGAGGYLRSVTPENSAVTVNLHHSLIKLPDDNYQPRAFHPYSGYWSVSYADYATPIAEPLVKRVIPRHRLKKKNPQAAVSEAVEPIIYYLDPGVPEPIKTALLDGARWWAEAFEDIGYKDAYQVKMLPDDADPMDVRYNVIQWVHRATRGWSYGSSVIDPRTGEIIKGHVTLGSLRVRQDYLIALGLTSPFTQKDTDTQLMQEMALDRIRQLSAHEVGHTIGIAHNFAASTNNRASVMDYPHPLITLENGEINLSNAYDKGIGAWDKFVVAYGYSDIPSDDESRQLATLISRAQSAGLNYISDPDARPRSGSHATAHLWDNGSNALVELERVMKVRAHALAKMGLNTIPEGTPLSELEKVLVPIYNFHRYQVEAAVKLIAGEEYSYELKSGNRVKGVKAVSGSMQANTVDQLIDTLSVDTLTIPQAIQKLIPPPAYGYGKTRESFKGNMGLSFDPISAADASAKHTLTLLLNAGRMARLAHQNSLDSRVPSVKGVVNKLLQSTIMQGAEKGERLLIQQRINQRTLDEVVALYLNKSLVAEVRAELYVSLDTLQSWLAKQSKSNALWGQYQLMQNQITQVITEGKLIAPATKATLPPGSPIGQ